MGYLRWLHTGWPAGTVERLPEVRDDGTTAVAGVRVVGDLRGVPLLKLAADSGARAVQAFLAERGFAERRGRDPAVVDVAIVGAGVSGVAAAMEAKKAGLTCALFEAAQPWNTLQNFPRHKPIFTYPTDLQPAGELAISATVKEALVDELEGQRQRAGVEVTAAHVDHVERDGDLLKVCFADGEREPVRALRVVVAIGRTGNYRALGVPGERLDKVTQRLYDPRDHAGQRALVVGGGDSAVEAAVALALAGAEVTLSYRGAELTRPKPDNLEKLQRLIADPAARVDIERATSDRVTASMTSNLTPGARHGSIRVLPGSRLREVRPESVVLVDGKGVDQAIPNDVVFAMIGREAPLDFFRRSGIPIRGEWRAGTLASLVAFFLLCLFVYTWKAGTDLNAWFSQHHLFPFNMPELGGGALAKALTITLREPGFYYSLAYTVAIVLFGIQRVRRRRTPYVRLQTLALASVQVVPLFLLPYVVLPWLGNLGAFDGGALKTVADNLFPAVTYGQGREYWRAFGLILAWPLFVWNFFSYKPMTWWLVIGCVQTFVIIPAIVYRWGKGAYCGWICSCGALAETMGDEQRQKMPHGPLWNRVNFVGQAILLWCLLLFASRVATWSAPASAIGRAATAFYDAVFYAHALYDYYHVVDIFLAGVVGVGLYFWFSGRVWCRFACPLAALMHIYARFSAFRIFADKKKCISCNVCTAVCHQGIDVMAFASKGLPMEDPQCVRCSACVQSCPTGTLSFGRVGAGGAVVLDRLAASPVQMAERGKDGRTHLRVAG